MGLSCSLCIKYRAYNRVGLQYTFSEGWINKSVILPMRKLAQTSDSPWRQKLEVFPSHWPDLLPSAHFHPGPSNLKKNPFHSGHFYYLGPKKWHRESLFSKWRQHLFSPYSRSDLCGMLFSAFTILSHDNRYGCLLYRSSIHNCNVQVCPRQNTKRMWSLPMDPLCMLFM